MNIEKPFGVRYSIVINYVVMVPWILLTVSSVFYLVAVLFGMSRAIGDLSEIAYFLSLVDFYGSSDLTGVPLAIIYFFSGLILAFICYNFKKPRL